VQASTKVYAASVHNFRPTFNSRVAILDPQACAAPPSTQSSAPVVKPLNLKLARDQLIDLLARRAREQQGGTSEV